MGLRDIGERLPPGFRFFPSDDELICHYLHNKVLSEEEVVRSPSAAPTLIDVDLHVCEPWQLPDVAKLNSNEWYFFSFKDRKYATGFRANRATATGYWKATGKDRAVLDPITRAIVGMRKTLVFYQNRAPNGIKTGWIMHEFRLEKPDVPPREDWVLCRVFHKSRSENIGHHSNEYIVPASSCGHHQTIIMNEPLHHHTQSCLSNYDYQNKAINNDQMTSRCEDDFGYLFELGCSNNMGFEDDIGPAFIG